MCGWDDVAGGEDAPSINTRLVLDCVLALSTWQTLLHIITNTKHLFKENRNSIVNNMASFYERLGVLCWLGGCMHGELAEVSRAA